MGPSEASGNFLGVRADNPVMSPPPPRSESRALLRVVEAPETARSQATAPGPDRTPEFLALYHRARSGRSVLPPTAGRHLYATVPGAFTKHYPTYFQETERHLRAQGLEVVRAPADTDKDVEENADVLRRFVLGQAARTGKRIVLVGHSKGPVDASAMLALYPEVLPHIEGLVAIQAPYLGSELVDGLAERGLPRRFCSYLVRDLLGGNENALWCLSTKAREAFVAAHPHPSHVRTVALASDSTDWRSITGLAGLYIGLRSGRTSDGLTSPERCEFPGAALVRLNELDHAAGALASWLSPSPYYPAPLTEALVALLLREPGALSVEGDTHPLLGEVSPDFP